MGGSEQGGHGGDRDVPFRAEHSELIFTIVST